MTSSRTLRNYRDFGHFSLAMPLHAGPVDAFREFRSGKKSSKPIYVLCYSKCNMESKKRVLYKKRAAIAKIAAEFFSKKGFAETSMDDIAAAAKLSKGGVYHYFPSKTEVLYFIVDNFMDVVLKDIEEELGTIDDGLEKVKRLISRHVELYPRHHAEAKTLVNAVHNLPPKSFKKIVEKEREYFRIAAEVLTGYFGSSAEKHEVVVMTFMLFSMCNSIYAWYNPKRTVSAEQLSQIMFDFLIDGICGIRKKPAHSHS